MESKNDTVTSPYSSKSTAQEIDTNKSTTPTEPYDSSTPISDSNSALTEVSEVNALLSVAFVQLGDN